VLAAGEYWMDACATVGQELAMATDPKINKLSDKTHALARLCGWDTGIDQVVRRLRCSKCGKKQCTWRAYLPTKPRGHSSLPR
jgi:hypothetical protein